MRKYKGPCESNDKKGGKIKKEVEIEERSEAALNEIYYLLARRQNPVAITSNINHYQTLLNIPVNNLFLL